MELLKENKSFCLSETVLASEEVVLEFYHTYTWQ